MTVIGEGVWGRKTEEVLANKYDMSFYIAPALPSYLKCIIQIYVFVRLMHLCVAVF